MLSLISQAHVNDVCKIISYLKLFRCTPFTLTVIADPAHFYQWGKGQRPLAISQEAAALKKVRPVSRSQTLFNTAPIVQITKKLGWER
jgi:hypothetical protein